MRVNLLTRDHFGPSLWKTDFFGAEQMTPAILILFALASTVPVINLANICHPADSGASKADREMTQRSCVADERMAARQLVRVWRKVPAVVRSSCADQSLRLSPSYVEMLTCVEMQTGGNFSVLGDLQP